MGFHSLKTLYCRKDIFSTISPCHSKSHERNKLGSTLFDRQREYNFFFLVDYTCRARWLVSKVGPAKLIPKGEPQYQNCSKAKSWRVLSKISPVEQIHQGAVKTRSIIICLFLKQRTHSFSRVFSMPAISLAHFSAWSWALL